MVAELTALRDQIDDVDKALLNLLAKRLELVAKVGEVKSRFGLPIYVPEREASMLASRRAEAEAIGVPPDLIEDVLRRVMRESYSSENDKGFKTLCLAFANNGKRRVGFNFEEDFGFNASRFQHRGDLV
ncbi:chorismate mutase, partial [Salmonella enterica subsp. enterica serovar Cerro]|nr:chorismate mutase [Salmonella enterica subsp. enterica serovar Cerro]